MSKLLLAAFAALLLTACGGGGSAEPSPTPTAAESASIQLFGDSTMVLAAPAWQARWANVTLSAKGGSTSAQLIDGTDGVNAPWPQSVTARYVVINHGLNDGYKHHGRIMLTIDEYKAHLRTLAVAPGATVIFQTPLPSTRVGRDMAPYAQAMREVAAERGLRVIDVYDCFQGLGDWQSHLRDQTHPDAVGVERMAECADSVVSNLAGVMP